MILAAALLVLVALGLFIWGIATGATALYWACVAVSAVAAVLLVVAFLRMRQVATATEPARARPHAEPGPAEPAALPVPVEERPAAPVTQVLPASPEQDGRAVSAPPAAVRATGAHAAVVPAQGEPAHAPDYGANGPGSSSASAADGRPSQASSLPSPAAAAEPAAAQPAGADDEDPPVEEVEVTDLLLVVDLHDDVFVVDEHPRYHLADCPWMAGRSAIPLPVDEARTDGFTPCGRCAPDRGLAELERGRRASRGSS